MSAHRPRRVDRRTAERLLSAVPTAMTGSLAKTDPDDLADLLAAAAAPAGNGEIPGEQATMAAFRAACLDPVPQIRRRQMIKTTLAKFLTVKVASAAVAATAAGGVAFAASTGALPNPLAGNTHPAHATGRPSADASQHPGGKASPSPSMVGLCHAYTAGVAGNQGKALDNPAFTALITAAGGKDKVADYCTTVLASAPGSDSAGKPSTHPTGRPSEVPAGQAGGDHATDHPTAQPTSHPTGH